MPNEKLETELLKQYKTKPLPISGS